MSENILEVEHLTHAFALDKKTKIKAVDDVSFQIVHHSRKIANIKAGILFGCFITEGFEGFNGCAGAVLTT